MERIYTILSLLKTKKQLSIEEICKRLYCSPATARRDIAKLTEMGTAMKIRGGVLLIEGTNFDYSANYRNSVCVREKEYICEIAADFIRPGMSLFLDSSSTAMRICPILSRIGSVTVLTNGMDTALLLNECDTVETYVTGGRLKKGTHTVLGEASDSLAGFRADLALIFCRGIDDDGAYDADIEQKTVKRQMMRNAKKTVLLCDSSKFGSVFFHKLTDFSDLEAVITDRKPPDSFLESVARTGCEVLYG